MSRNETTGRRSLYRVILISAILIIALTFTIMKSKIADSPQRDENSSPLELIESENKATIELSEEDVKMLLIENEMQEKLQKMTLAQKVGQMFMITPEALTDNVSVTQAGDITFKALEEYPIGGLIYFASNIVTPSQTTEMLKSTQNYAKELMEIPIFTAIDEEGGLVARIGNNDNFEVAKFPNMQEIGAAGDLDQAYEVGNDMGSYLNQCGFNLDFAPCADVLSNPENKVIGTRSFGSDARFVAEMSLKVMEGLQANQVYACFKHFPGHGGTEGDTHEGYSYTNKTLEELLGDELIPFQEAINHKVEFIMISHIAAPNVTNDKMPASLSKIWITEILREQMGYDGIVITDALNMGAITNQYDSKTAVLKAIDAGVDILLMPDQFMQAYQGVMDAVAEGNITEERIDQSVARILRVKMQ